MKIEQGLLKEKQKELKQLIEQYIKENLKIYLDTNMIEIDVRLELDGETISSSSRYVRTYRDDNDY